MPKSKRAPIRSSTSKLQTQVNVNNYTTSVFPLQAAQESVQRSRLLKRHFWSILTRNPYHSCREAELTNEKRLFILNKIKSVRASQSTLYIPAEFSHLSPLVDSINFSRFVLEAVQEGKDILSRQIDGYLGSSEGTWASVNKQLRNDIDFELHVEILREIANFLFAKKFRSTLADCLAFAYVHIGNDTSGSTLNWFLGQVDRGYSVGHVLLSNLSMHLVTTLWPLELEDLADG